MGVCRLSKISSLLDVAKGAGHLFMASGNEYAPGLPERRTSSLPKVDRPQVWEFSAHPHKAERAGEHIDMRLGNPETGIAHSFVLPKAALPGPGESALVVQTFDHTLPYMDFTGRITSEYGKGEVLPGRREKAEVYHSLPEDGPGTKIRFNLYGGDHPEEFALRKDGRGNWFLHNKTQTRERRPDIPGEKPSYREIHPDKIDVTDSTQAMMPKLDGAHGIIDLRAGRAPRAFSYRVAKRAGTGLIEHTHKMPALLTKKVPKEFDRTILRAELMGVTSEGRAIPSEILSGLLNSKVWSSRAQQEMLGVRVKPFPFDVVVHKGKDAQELPYEEKRKILEQVTKEIDELELPLLATTTAEKLDLLNKVKSGKYPLTDEGVVLVEPGAVGGRPIKSVLRPTFDVHVREIFQEKPGKLEKEKDRAGGFRFSWTPDGPIVGRIGTGFGHEVAKDMLASPEKYLGRVAKVEARKVNMKGAELGALQKPSFKEWHLDKGDIEKGAATMAFESRTQESVKHSAFLEELEEITKEGGIRDAIQVALTGRVPLRHGTTKEIAEQILEHGLKPQGSPGISNLYGLRDLEQGLSFLTRSPVEAGMYAQQAAGLARTGKIKELIRKLYPRPVRAFETAAKESPLLEQLPANILGKLPGGKQVVQANVPRSSLRGMERGIPELAQGVPLEGRKALREVGKEVAERVRDVPVVGPALGRGAESLEHLPAFPFRSTVAVEGGVPAQFMKGSPQYQRTTLKEVGEHFRQAKEQPVEYGKDVLRALTGVSHRPSTMIRKADATKLSAVGMDAGRTFAKVAGFENQLLAVLARRTVGPSIRQYISQAEESAKERWRRLGENPLEADLSRFS